VLKRPRVRTQLRWNRLSCGECILDDLPLLVAIVRVFEGY
jgi:hypothetical protein